jgi:hypothetical protein
MRSQVYVKLNMLRFSAEMECKMQPGEWHCEGRRKDEIDVMVLCPLHVSSAIVSFTDLSPPMSRSAECDRSCATTQGQLLIWDNIALRHRLGSLTYSPSPHRSASSSGCDRIVLTVGLAACTCSRYEPPVPFKTALDDVTTSRQIYEAESLRGNPSDQS